MRSRCSLRHLSAVVVLAVASGSALAAAATAAPVSGPQPADEHVAEERARDRTARANSDSDEERDRRLRSRRAFRGLSPAEALELAEARHPEFVLLPAWRAPALPLAHEIIGYQNDFVARVAAPDGSADQLVLSNAPMRAVDSAGSRRPVDLTLESDDTAFRAVNPLADISLRRRLRDGLRLDGIGLVVRPVVDAEREPVLSGDTLFYANALTDADVLVRPAVTGFSVHTQLRSEDSPEQIVMELDVPPGVTLHDAEASQAIEVRRDGDVIGSVTAPVAADADGRPVELTWRLDGQRLEIVVPHRGRDYAYPLLVDPTVTESFEWERWGVNPGYGNFAGWKYTGQGNFAGLSYAGPDGDPGWLGDGLYIRPNGTSYWFNVGHHGKWVWRAPGFARMPQVEWNLVDHRPEKTEIELGVIRHPVDGSSGPVWYSSPATNNPDRRSGNVYNEYFKNCANTCASTDGNPGDEAQFSVVAREVNAYRSNFVGQVGVVYLRIRDIDYPAVGSDLPEGWVNWSATKQLPVWALDPSTGISEVRLTSGTTPTGTPAWEAKVGPNIPYRCSRTYLCPRAHGTDPLLTVGALPEGINTIEMSAKDPAGNELLASREIRATGAGLRAEYFDSSDFTSRNATPSTAEQVNFNWGSGKGHPNMTDADHFSVRWSGYVTAPETGTYTFRTEVDDGVRLWVHDLNHTLIDAWRVGVGGREKQMYLHAGQKYAIVMEFFEKTGNAFARLLWMTPSSASSATPSFVAVPKDRLSPPAGWQLRLDRTPPSVTGLAGSLHDRAGRGANGTDYTLRVNATDGVFNGPARDRRVGGKNIEVQIADEDGMRTKKSPDRTCAMDSCPLQEDFQFNALDLGREGLKKISARGRDLLEHAGNFDDAKFEVVVDRTAPTLEPLEGSAVQGYLAAGHYDLRAIVRDPAPLGVNRSSGPRDVRVRVDGQTITTVPAGDCPANAVCRRARLHATGPSALAEGPHTIEVVGLDAADNESTPRILNVFVDRSSGQRLHFGLARRDLGTTHKFAVNAANGNLNVSVQDQLVEQGGLDLSVKRSYNSRRRGAPGSFGGGWTLDGGDDFRLEALDDGVVRVLGPSGWTAAFEPVPGTTTQFGSPFGVLAELSRAGDGRYVLDFYTEEHDLVFPAAGGEAQREVDEVGYGFGYTYSDGLLSAIEHDSGTDLTVSQTDGRISSIAGPDGDDSYGYVGGQLTSHSGPSGNATYTYHPDGRLDTVFTGGHPGLGFIYDVEGRVSQIRELSAPGVLTGPTTTITYPASGRTVVTAPDGTQTTYTYEPGNAFATRIEVGADAPALSLSGALWDLRGQSVPEGTHPLSAAASGPSGATPTRIAVDIDDGEEHRAEQPAGTAALTTSWDFESGMYPSGDYVVEVEALASNGSTTTERFGVTSSTPASEPEPPLPAGGTSPEEDQAYRRNVGIESDLGHIAGVRADPANVARSGEYGVPLTADELAELELRDTLIDEAAEMMREYVELNNLENTYAGTYMDHAGGGNVVAGFTENADVHLAVLQQLFTQPARLEAVSAEHSAAALEELYEAVSADIAANQPEGISIQHVHMDIIANRVNIGVPGITPAQEQTLRDRYGAAAAINDDGGVEAFTHRVKAGFVLWDRPDVETGKRLCTSNFSVRSNRPDRPGKYRYYFVTAGHCSTSDGEQFYIRDDFVSMPAGRAVPGTNLYAADNPVTTDAVLLRTRGTRVSRLINGRAYPRRVVRTEDEEDEEDEHVHRVARQVCYMGIASGYHCGPFDGLFTGRQRNSDKQVKDMKTITLGAPPDGVDIDEYGCRHRDSGAPFYRRAIHRRAIAVGVMVGGRPEGRGPLDDHKICVYSHFSDVESRLNVELFVGRR